jgi:hypothetical protein
MNHSSRYSVPSRKHANPQASARERHPSNHTGREHPPVDRSPEHDEESSSDSEHALATNDMPVTREHDRNRSPLHARSRNEGHGVRNHNHLERRPTTDITEQRKRKLYEEISLAIKGTNKRKKSEQESFIIFGGR